MNPAFIFAILYTISVRTPIPCGPNVSCTGVSCSWSCYTTDGESHFVEIDDYDKAMRFVENLKPYNHYGPLDKDVPDHKRFIWGMKVQAYTKLDGKWTMINEHEVTEYGHERVPRDE
jgi:hypothetical protein